MTSRVKASIGAIININYEIDDCRGSLINNLTASAMG